jgi:hypothetical protein
VNEKVGGMSAQNSAQPIIIKRKKVIAGGGHHGGAWKVAIVRPSMDRRFAPSFTFRQSTATEAF